MTQIKSRPPGVRHPDGLVSRGACLPGDAATPRELRLRAGIAEHLGDFLVEAKQPTFSTSAEFGLDEFDVKFDVVLAQSIFSHTFRDLTALGFSKIAAALQPDGMLVGTFVERVPFLPPGVTARPPTGGSGWFAEGSVPYTWRELRGLLAGAGLQARPLRWWHHRQTWFVASRP